MLDKIKGGLFGFAIGDALGAVTEFMSEEEIAEEYGSVTSFIGGGVWDVEPGETTDDTAMTIAVAKGIISNSKEPIEEIGRYFLKWRDTKPKDIGIAIRTAFHNYSGDWYKAAEETHKDLGGRSGGNGSLMRCLPIALAYSDEEKIEELSNLQSKMTHYDDRGGEACVIYNRIAKRILEGEELKAAILAEVKNTRYESDYLVEPDCPPDGFVVNTMKWVFYWLLHETTFKGVVVGAANMGGDSDTIAAIAGGLKGLEVGFFHLPPEYKNSLLDKVQLEEIANILVRIRDKDTVRIREGREEIFKEIESGAAMLYQLAEQQASVDEMLNAIRENIYLYRVCIQDDEQDFEKRYFKWRCIENRFKRSARLFDLGAPTIIILHELDWLLTEINHLSQLLRGVEPSYTQEQLEELQADEDFEVE